MEMKQVCFDYLMEQFADEDIVKEIYQEYVNSIEEKSSKLVEALASGDWTELGHVAHAIKGNALASGDKAMADAAIELRVTAQLQNKERSQELTDIIKNLAKEL